MASKDRVVKANDLDFDFYLPLKGEDAHPIRKDNLLLICDGFGGSGSTLHSLKTDEATKEVFKKAAFEEVAGFEKEIKTAIAEIFEETEEGLSKKTSAFLASRIISIRFAYKVGVEDYKDEKGREAIAKFVTKGLQNVVDAFAFPPCAYDAQTLLPSTLCALLYEEKEGKLLVDSLWAGDSRSYCLNKDGLRFLSEDDEDEDKYVDNYFHAYDAKRREPYLNYRHYEFEEPTLIFACSDGVFDPFGDYDALGVGYLLTKSILRSDGLKGAPCKEAGERLLEEYASSYQEDDTTLALHSFGYKNFKAIKKSFNALGKTYEALFTKLNASLDQLSAAGESEEQTEEYLTYVPKRAATAYPHLLKGIIDLYLAGKKDFALSKPIVSSFKPIFDSEMKRKKVREGLFEEAVLSGDYVSFVFGENPIRSSKVRKLIEEYRALDSKGYDHDVLISKKAILAYRINSSFNPSLEASLSKEFLEEENRRYLLLAEKALPELKEVGERKQKEFLEAIVSSYEKNPRSASELDRMFNGTRLAGYRLRLTMKGRSSQSLTKLREALEEIDALSTSLLK